MTERAGLLQRLAAALVSRPLLYDFVQAAAGQALVIRRLRSATGPLPQGRVLDVGSAGGRVGLGLGMRPVCLDIDVRPLLDRRRRDPLGLAVQGDAARLPFLPGAFDLTLCTAVSHHLDDESLPAALAEIARVTTGTFLFFDASRDDSRWLSRWLWRFDRGRHPRTRDDLRRALDRCFDPRTTAAFAVLHTYYLFLGTPRESRRLESSRPDSQARKVS